MKPVGSLPCGIMRGFHQITYPELEHGDLALRTRFDPSILLASGVQRLLVFSPLIRTAPTSLRRCSRLSVKDPWYETVPSILFGGAVRSGDHRETNWGR
jgi:hypothetical protein